jgi:phosphohistidine phosphatase
MSCTIYLVRHAIAGPAETGMSDADRTLTVEGQRKMVRVVRGLKRLGIEPDVVLTSPLKRADETARLLVGGLAPGADCQTLPRLAPGNSPVDVASALHAYGGKRHVMLVGHEPDLGHLASHLLAGSATLAALPFKKGGVAAIRVGALPPHSGGVLLWFLTPKQLRLIGR